jgi:hypothetical protein
VEANVEANLAVLARHGADLTARNAEGKTPLEMAEEMGHDECLAVLAAHGVSSSTADAGGDGDDSDSAVADCTPFCEAVTLAVVDGAEDEVERLLQERADPNGCDNCRLTPLMETAYHGHAGIMRLLIAAGADVNKPTDDDATALHWCTDVEVAQLLIDARADVGARDATGQTPLDRHVMNQNLDVARLLSASHTVGGFRCANPRCGKAGTKACQKCNVTRYCSRECQRADWPTHKRSCGADAFQSIVRDVDALQGALASGSTGGWHAGLTFKRLVERFTMSFRLRVEDEHTFGGQPHGKYRAQAIGDIEGRLTANEFRAYYEKAKATGLFPSGWNVDNEAKLLQRAKGVIHSALRKSDVVERFGYSSNEHHVLRSIAEQILGPIGCWPLEVRVSQASFGNNRTAPVQASDAVPDRLPAGAHVQLKDLVSKPELNGTPCRVRVFDAEVGRYAVELPDGSCIRVKLECVTPVDRSSAGGQQPGGNDQAHRQGRPQQALGGSISARTGRARMRHIGSFSREELRRIGWTGDTYFSHSQGGLSVPYVDGYDSDSDESYEPIPRR